MFDIIEYNPDGNISRIVQSGENRVTNFYSGAGDDALAIYHGNYVTLIDDEGNNNVLTNHYDDSNIKIIAGDGNYTVFNDLTSLMDSRHLTAFLLILCISKKNIWCTDYASGAVHDFQRTQRELNFFTRIPKNTD